MEANSRIALEGGITIVGAAATSLSQHFLLKARLVKQKKSMYPLQLTGVNGMQVLDLA